MEHVNSDLMLWYWNSLRKGRIAPNQSDIDLRAISKVLSRIFILEASIPSQPTYRLAGTQLCAWYGSELKGKSFLAHWDRDASETLAWLLHRGMRLHLPLCIHSLCARNSDRTVALETTLAPIRAGSSEPTRFIGLSQTLGATTEISGMNFAFHQLSNAHLCDAEIAVAPKLSPSDLAFDRHAPSDDTEGSLTGQKFRLATATAIDDCEMMEIEKGVMATAIHTEPAFSELFVAHLLTRNLRVEADLVDQLFNSSERRLARALLLLANFGREGSPDHVIANVSQEMLAEMIGTTRPRVSFFMNKFRRLGFISYNGQIEVHRSLLNLVLHEQPHIETK